MRKAWEGEHKKDEVRLPLICSLRARLSLAFFCCRLKAWVGAKQRSAVKRRRGEAENLPAFLPSFRCPNYTASFCFILPSSALRVRLLCSLPSAYIFFIVRYCNGSSSPIPFQRSATEWVGISASSSDFDDSFGRLTFGFFAKLGF